MTTVERPTVVIVDDHELFRQGLQALLASQFEVLGVGATGQDAVQLCLDTAPDLLVLDVELGDVPAEQTVRAVRRTSPAVVIVILTMFRDVVLQQQLLRAGASDFVTKTVDQSTLVEHLRKGLVAGPARAHADVPEEEGVLSRRELEVLRLISGAASNRDIALQLSISEATVKRHVANIFLKLGAVSRIDAVLKARLLGVLI